MIKKLYLLLLCLYAVILNACGQSTSDAYHLMLNDLYSHTVASITVTALHQKLTSSNTRKPVVLDTRTRQEYEVSHLKGARFAGYDTFAPEKLKGIAKSTPIVVYCTVGYRSEKIGEKLKAAGFANVYNLYGGLFEWVNSGYKVYNTSGPTTKVHAYSPAWGIWLQKGEGVYEQ